MMRTYLTATGLALACALTATGCTGGGPESSPSPTVTPTASRWQRGEITTDPGLCAALGPDLLSRLGLQGDTTGAGGSCELSVPDSGAAVHRTLTVRGEWYEPPPARPHHTATDEARHEFARPPGWGYGQGLALRGFGDEAKISRTISTFRWDHEISVAVRVRNLVFQVRLTGTTEKVDAFGKVPPVARLERDALDVTRALLARLRAPARLASPAAYRPGEIRKVHDVCGDVPDGADRVPGAKRSGRSAATSGGRSAGCAWLDDDDSLTVTVEAVSPGADGKDATSTAADATRAWGPGGDTERVSGLGDQATVRTYDEDGLRDVDLWVRHGNLLVNIGYQRWRGTPSAGAMRDDAVKISRKVLDSYS